MRQLFVQVPRGRGRVVLDAARRHRGVNLTSWEAESADGPEDVVLVHLPNGGVGDFVAELQDSEGFRVSFQPAGVLALHPPAEETPDQVLTVERRSPLEVFLSGLQSKGSWRGFLGYSAVAGIVVWTGLFTNTVFLLVGAMLIAPFAGPAMLAAMATARGDARLLVRSAARYFSAIGVTVLVAALLSLAFRQRVVTPLMTSVADVSSAAVLIPLAAGAAGALHLSQSERSSLVSGAGVGLLIAASLAPPAGIIGMATALGEWNMVRSSVFLLLLQLAGIQLAGSVAFRVVGLRSEGPRYPAGRARVANVALAASILAVAVLVAWQQADVPELQRATLAERARAEVRDVVDGSGLARYVDSSVEYTRPHEGGPPTLLVQAFVADRPDGPPPAEVRERLTDAVRERLDGGGYGAVPLVDVTVLEPPG